MKAILFILFFAVNAFGYKIGFVYNNSSKYNSFIQDMYLASQAYANKVSTTKNLNDSIYCKHDGTVNSIKKAVKKCLSSNVDIVIGGVTSDWARLISKYTESSGVVFLTPTASSHKVLDYNKNVFRFAFDDKKVPKVLDFIIDKERIEKIFVYRNMSRINTSFISKNIVSSLNNKKVSFLLGNYLSDEELSLSDLKRIKENDVEYISMFSFEADLRNTISKLRKNNRKAIFIGADGWGSNRSVKNKYFNDNLFEGLRLMYWNSTRSDVLFQKAKKIIEDATNGPINGYKAIAYDVMSVLDQSISLSLKTKKSLVDVLKNTKFSNLISSKSLKFSNDLIAIKDLYIYKITNKSIELYGTIDEL